MECLLVALSPAGSSVLYSWKSGIHTCKWFSQGIITLTTDPLLALQDYRFVSQREEVHRKILPLLTVQESQKPSVYLGVHG